MEPKKVSFSERQQEVARMAAELSELEAKFNVWAFFLKEEAARMAEAGRKFEARIQKNKKTE